MRHALAVLIAAAAASFPGDARAERYCSFTGSGATDCSYASLEACRASTTNQGRCSPESWVSPKQPAAKRVSAPKQPAGGYPRMEIDPPSYLQKTTIDPLGFDRHTDIRW
jgi:hypothetical protein